VDFKTVANISRFKEIVVILFKYGFDDLVHRLDLPGAGLVRKIHRADTEMGTYERIRCALEDLGPTFIKFGQIMSLRPDLLPQPLIQELSRLQDEVPGVDYSEVKGVVEASLGQPLEQVFSVFDETPLAAASLSQVHRGVLRSNGEVVAAKVQRPGITQKIQRDLDILSRIAERIHERSEDMRVYDIPRLVRVTRRNLLRELNFKGEARYMKIARARLMEHNGIFVPRVYDDLCAERLLVMEFVKGSKLKDIDVRKLEAPEFLARQGFRSAVKQILEDGFFHADPHPGNLLIAEGPRLCLVDWGMVGRLSERDRYELMDLIRFVVESDGKGLMEALIKLSDAGESVDRRALERELLTVLDSYYAVPLKDLNLGQLLLDITTLLREYRLRLPADLVIMVKALITAEGTARKIYPELDVFEEARGHIKRLTAQRLRPEVLWRRIRSSIWYFLSRQGDIPRQLAQVVEKMERGELNIRFQHQNLSGLRRTLDNVSNRVTFGIITGSMIIGSSMIITTGVKPLLFGFPALGIIGYVISGLLGLWLVFNIIRARRY